ncbi:hypothetical protein E2C01_099481 [Portunus trituberculatus]|uniref:Uncharacterized protein n=1 Tax=Portunus trituberculatus TaxID=210409 RepID=A0A5B7KAH7_PORTR|nr:hypothetical protein [Portunus trituberculatus]
MHQLPPTLPPPSPLTTQPHVAAPQSYPPAHCPPAAPHPSIDSLLVSLTPPTTRPSGHTSHGCWINSKPQLGSETHLTPTHTTKSRVINLVNGT